MIHLLLFAAAVSCPALNTATVRGAFGDLQATVTRAKNSSGYMCVFTKPEYKLSVEVTPLSATHAFEQLRKRACRHAQEETPLSGVGNEAVACLTGSAGRMEDKVAGRVRDQAFVIALSTTDKMADAKDIRNKITMLAEEVAGNLF